MKDEPLDMTDIAIRTENLTRDFATVRAVDHLTLNVPRGIVFGFLGPNGSGKTTTIRMLLGLLEPTEGTAEVLGYSVRREADEIRERAGALLEHTGLYERLSAEDNLEYFGRIYRMEKPAREARIRELLTHFGLWDRRGELVKDWSKGMRQKLAIARALMHRPPLVILDEPTSGLDPVAAVSVRDDLASLVEQEGVTVFLNTHNLPEAEKLCHLVGVIREGRLLAVGHPDELRSQVGRPSITITGSGFDDAVLDALRAHPEVAAAHAANGRLTVELLRPVEAGPLVALLVGAGASVEEVRKGQASLEDVFLALMNGEDNHAG